MNQELIIRFLADGLMLPIVLVGIYALVFKIPNDNKLDSYKRILVAGLTAYMFAKLIGTFFQPESLRPFELIGASAGASFLNNPGFPSDHTLFATALTCAVWFETKQKALTIAMAALILGVAVGRVLALVHTPIDVIGGILIALTGSLWYLDR